MDWNQRIREQPGGKEAAWALMKQVNPVRIPRNHLVEAALDAADAGDMAPFYKLLDALQSPYDAHVADPTFIGYPVENESTYRTYCGT
jgi:uncharacterized protein YdiU (UPF0061 family)